VVSQSLRASAAHAGLGNETNRRFAPIHMQPVVRTTSAAELENCPFAAPAGVTEVRK
jgi:hypothetical protein